MMDKDRTILLDVLAKLLNLPRELSTVEFKSNWDHADDIGEYISALANSAALEGHERAWMVWGVEDPAHKVIGTDFNPYTAKGAGNQSLIMWLTQHISPRPDLQYHELTHPDGRIIILEIYPPRNTPLAFKGIRYIRIDSHKSKLAEYPDKEARLWGALGVVEDWTGHIVQGATIADLEPEAITFARGRFTEYLLKNEQDTARHDKIRADASSWDIPTLLNKARLTKQGHITRSALILLGRDESAHLLAPADIKISWVSRDDRNNTVGSPQHFGMPFLLSTDALFRRIRNLPMEYMPDGTLFPTPVLPYDPWVIREALHNCIAHQDYRLGGKINTVEHPDRLVFTNIGAFIPPNVEWMLEHQSPPEQYRNPWLIDGMVRLRMIDQIGSGIRRMFETQRERFFPLPDYVIDSGSVGAPRVEVSISGRIMDMKYTKILMRRTDLTLHQVVLLDHVQKRRGITPEEARELKARKLIEGRTPNYYISAKVADWTGQKASYIHNRALDDDYYRQLILEYLRKYQRANRQELGGLLLAKLPDILETSQKQHKIRNLIQSLRRDGFIRNSGTRGMPIWVLGEEGFATNRKENND